MANRLQGLMSKNPAGDAEPMDLQNRIETIVKDIRDIIQEAKKEGVYDDKQSMGALNGLLKGAMDIQQRWMEDKGAAAPDQAPSPDGYNPAKLIETTGGKDNGPFSGPMEPKNPITSPNPMGGNIVHMPSPNHGLPPWLKK